MCMTEFSSARAREAIRYTPVLPSAGFRRRRLQRAPDASAASMLGAIARQPAYTNTRRDHHAPPAVLSDACRTTDVTTVVLIR